MTKMVTLYLNEKALKTNEYVPGLGPDGNEFPEDKAQALLDAGLALKTKPKPATPAKPEDKE